MMKNKFIYSPTKSLFEKKLAAGQIGEGSVVFIEDTKEIWNRGHYFGMVDSDSFGGILVGNDEATAEDGYIFIDEDDDNSIDIYTTEQIDEKVSNLQPTLIDGENIKTINGASILGSGNLNITGGIVNITWAELKELRDAKNLTVGTYYRITDYVTTTLQENTRSAGHAFDVIVLATDVDTLSEEAMAAVHEGDTYFTEAGANLSAWKIWYSLDNDTTKYSWAGKNILLGKIKPASGVGASGTYIYDKPIVKVFFNTTSYNLSVGIKTMIHSGPPVFVTLIDSYTLHIEETSAGYVAATQGIEVYSEETIGKGVIYRMIDEYNNDLPYDFKNIIYMAKPSFSVYTHYGSSYFATFTMTPDTQVIEGITYYKYIMTYKASGPFTPSDELWTDVAIPTTKMGVYTIVDGIVNNESYTIFNIFSDKYDAYTFSTILGNDTNDASLSRSVYNNTMKGFYNNGILQLNKNIFITTAARASFYSNNFGNNCHSNRFGNDSHSNNFSNNCYFNNFGNNCCSNRFGNDCVQISSGDYFEWNSFGDNCHSVYFGEDGKGNNYYYNSFGNGISECYLVSPDNYYSCNVQNYHITNGFTGTVEVERNRYYETTVALDSEGNIKVYCAADFDKQIANAITTTLNTEV